MHPVAVASLASLIALALCGWMMDLSLTFYGVLGAVALFLGQQAWTLRGEVSPTRAFAMFKQHIWVGWAILGGFWIGFV